MSVNALRARHRVTEFGAYLIGMDGRNLGQIGGVVSGGTITGNRNQRARTGGTLTIKADAAVTSWNGADIQPFIRVNGHEWLLGTFIPDTPTAQVDATGVTMTVELQSRLTRLDGTQLPATLSVAAGVNVPTYVTNLIRDAGLPFTNIRPGNVHTRTALVFDPGTPLLTVCNELLASVDYWALDTDPHGNIVSGPYVSPVVKTPAWTFTPGPDAIHSATWERTEDRNSVPNRVILHTASYGETPALTATAINEDPASPFSYPARRFYVDRSDTVEAETQAQLQAMANRRLAELSTPAVTASVQVAPVPLALNDVVMWGALDPTGDGEGDPVRMVVETWTVYLDAGRTMALGLRKVNA